MFVGRIDGAGMPKHTSIAEKGNENIGVNFTVTLFFQKIIQGVIKFFSVKFDHSRFEHFERIGSRMGFHILFYQGLDLCWRSEERRVGKECRSRWWTYH